MCYTAFCIVDGPARSASIIAELGLAGFTDTEISIAAATAQQVTGTHHAGPPDPVADAQPPWSVRRSVVGATLGLIAGLSVPSIMEAGRGQRQTSAHTEVEGAAALECSPSSGDADASLEQVRTLAYHLSPGRELISVKTANSYEIETILEIFRAQGALYFSHLADNAELDDEQAGPAAAVAVHSRATVMSDRMREA